MELLGSQLGDAIATSTVYILNKIELFFGAIWDITQV